MIAVNYFSTGFCNEGIAYDEKYFITLRINKYLLKLLKDQTSKKIRSTVELYNMIPNFFWSLLSLVPLACFCYQRMPVKTVYISWR